MAEEIIENIDNIEQTEQTLPILEVKGLKKSWGEKHVLKGIDFSLNKGEVLAIIGSSGGGKTTLLRCLNFLETPTEGQIVLNGEVIFDAATQKQETANSIRKKRLHFGLVFQQFNLFPHMTALKNIEIAAELLAKDDIKEEYKRLKASGVKGKELISQTHKYKVAKYAEIEKTALALIERVGLIERKDYYPCRMSGGQQQRIAIARALALAPDILCFDEPTSALDPELTNEVLKVIKGLKSSDRTMIIVTHEMEFARNVADKVIFITGGIIEEAGTPEEVFGNPKSEKTISFLAKSKEI